MVVPLTLLSMTIGAAFAQLPEDLRRKFDEAERRIVRLQPDAFPELPGSVTRELQRRGCSIPQHSYALKPHSVIKGEFARPGQTDWAVLCSVNQTSRLSSIWTEARYVSSILVFWNGSGSNPAEIARMEDRNFLQSDAGDRINYSRGIAPAGKAFIEGHYRVYGGPKPPPIDHLGIDDAFIEKASVTWYFYGGKWLKLTGAD